MYHCYFLINYIGPPKVFFISFGPLFKKFAHHCIIPTVVILKILAEYNQKDATFHNLVL